MLVAIVYFLRDIYYCAEIACNLISDHSLGKLLRCIKTVVVRSHLRHPCLHLCQSVNHPLLALLHVSTYTFISRSMLLQQIANTPTLQSHENTHTTRNTVHRPLRSSSIHSLSSHAVSRLDASYPPLAKSPLGT